ncbi:MAG TPA: site-specific DNA-methyltransferase [Ignavibacteria bacterium]
MINSSFYKALEVTSEKELNEFAKKSKVSISKLKHYATENILPTKDDLIKIIQASNLSEIEFKLKLGIIDETILDAIKINSHKISNIICKDVKENIIDKVKVELVFNTDLGKLYNGDCISLMQQMQDESVDLIFADPPFNLDKSYESQIDDNLSKEDYIKWTEKWVLKCVDLLKPGGSLFIWNLPKWNTYISNILNKYLTFRNWIAIDIKYRLPIKNRLYPSHYSLLYYIKGDKSSIFNEQRVPLEVCRLCGGDIKDYGGYKHTLNTSGINLSDVWYDIPPVRHSKYKTRDSNELSLKLLERIISMTTKKGDVVFDPFGGSGTTYVVSEVLGRRWVGVEIGPVDCIINRFKEIESQKSFIEDIQKNKNILFTEKTRKIRIKHGHWLPEQIKQKNRSNPND